MLRMSPVRSTATFALVALALGCHAEPATVAPSSSPTGGATDVAVDDAWGGRIFDRWHTELGVAFDPGKSGGPAGDGTLADGNGARMSHQGHDFRLKNLFGWDLRGAEGIYGAAYQNKAFVLPVNLLTDTRSNAELAAWIAQGDERMPAFGAVLSEPQIAAVVAFIDGVRSERLPNPAQIFELSTTAPKNYTLRPGGDAARGTALFAEACARCHGDDGRTMLIDGELTVGAYSRLNAHEAWFKILNGHAGSPMKRELTFATGAQGAAQILDLLAALCDRAVFPAATGAPADADVPEGDARCAAYLR